MLPCSTAACIRTPCQTHWAAYRLTMGRESIPLVLALALCSETALAQTTHVITGGGSALQAGIQTATAGDVLDVQPGTYTQVVCSKGVHIHLQPGAEIKGPFGTGPNGLKFVGVPANETAIVSGGVVYRLDMINCAGSVVVDSVVFNPMPTGNLMHIESCSGAIVFVDSAGFRSASGSFGGVDFFCITDSDQVSFTRCCVPRLEIRNSNLTATDTTLQASGLYMESLLLVSGRVMWQGGRINGHLPNGPAPFRLALRVNGGEFAATGSAVIETNFLTPGSAETSIVVNAGLVQLDPSVLVAGSPAITGPGTTSVITTPIPSLSASHTANTMNVDVASEPGDAVFVLAGLPKAPYATPWGPAWILPTDPLLHATIAGPSGMLSFPYNFAAVPSHFVLTLQPVALRSTGSIRIGAAQRFAWN